MKQIKTVHTTIKNVCDDHKWPVIRSCVANDLILVAEGVQCSNCGALRSNIKSIVSS